MKIGMIGAGSVGSTLARGLSDLGHDVVMANSRGPETLRELADECGAGAVTVEEAARGNRLVVVAIPEKNIPALPSRLFAGLSEDVVVVDAGNYYPRHRDGRIAAIEAGMVESRWVEQQLGHPVVKAFNNIFATQLAVAGLPVGTPYQIALPVAGDDPAAKALVCGVVDQLGFDPVDAGPLDESWRQQPDTPVYTADLSAAALRQALARATSERKLRLRATDASPGSFEEPR